jgi:hypothetical protein
MTDDRSNDRSIARERLASAESQARQAELMALRDSAARDTEQQGAITDEIASLLAEVADRLNDLDAVGSRLATTGSALADADRRGYGGVQSDYAAADASIRDEFRRLRNETIAEARRLADAILHELPSNHPLDRAVTVQPPDGGEPVTIAEAGSRSDRALDAVWGWRDTSLTDLDRAVEVRRDEARQSFLEALRSGGFAQPPLTDPQIRSRLSEELAALERLSLSPATRAMLAGVLPHVPSRIGDHWKGNMPEYKRQQRALTDGIAVLRRLAG